MPRYHSMEMLGKKTIDEIKCTEILITDLNYNRNIVQIENECIVMLLMRVQ